MTDVSIRAGRRRIRISHADRVVFPDPGLTKENLARHYATVGPAMVPHVRDRPLALQSFPKGVGEGGFFLKNVPRHFPDWIATVEVPRREGGTLRQVLAQDTATLAYLAGQNVVTPHVGTSRADRLDVPDRLVFDLDPTTTRFEEVRAAALGLGALLREIGMTPYVMTTGSRGMHVVTPLRRSARHDEVHAFSREVAAVLVARSPGTLTAEFMREKRGDRIYVDVARNRYAQHAVAPYAVRPLPGASVATPLTWDEAADPAIGPQAFDVRSVAARLERVGDPWETMVRHARGIGPARRALAGLASLSRRPRGRVP